MAYSQEIVVSIFGLEFRSPLTWASWHLRPDSILRLLCYDGFQIRPERRSMAGCLAGEPRLEHEDTR
jgi:hypothetical protein